MGVQARHDTGATHAVPLVAQAAGVEMQRMARVGGFGQRAMLRWPEAGAAAGSGEHPIGIEAGRAGRGAYAQRPLLRPGSFKQCIGQAADVEVAADGRGAVLVEDLLGVCIGKQGRIHYSVRAERSRSPPFDRLRANGGKAAFQPPREIDDDLPIGPRLARRWHRRLDARDAAL